MVQSNFRINPVLLGVTYGSSDFFGSSHSSAEKIFSMCSKQKGEINKKIKWHNKLGGAYFVSREWHLDINLPSSG